MRKYFEPIGLLLLLFSFCFNCEQNHLENNKIQGYYYDTYHKIESIWYAEYDKAVIDGRISTPNHSRLEYESADRQFEEWTTHMRSHYEQLDKQISYFSVIWKIMYILGSILIIKAKLYDEKN